MTESEPRPHPKVTTFVGSKPGRYRRKAAVQDVTGVGAGHMVRLGVGDGVTTADLPALVAYAHRVRDAAQVQIIGRTPKAVEQARKLLLAAWQLDAGPVAAAGSSTASWAALMLAHVDTPDTGSGR
ncbi:hypothetical protein [Streptomyces sp. NPDC008139]|uniref:hypothetical protein n=1 Tax=Streptomyces sp. NPDC008139 TaxID=3364814 RepID=UPI0036E3F254